jgi:hypothetical protein
MADHPHFDQHEMQLLDRIVDSVSSLGQTIDAIDVEFQVRRYCFIESSFKVVEIFRRSAAIQTQSRTQPLYGIIIV